MGKKLFFVLPAVLIAAFLLFGCTQPASNNPPVNLADLLVPPSAVLGDANAPVTVVEYSDYQCPVCREWFLQSKSQLVNDYVNTGKVQFEFKDFPLLQIHPLSLIYAEAARCAGEQGKYFQMHDKIYNEQDKLAGGQITTVSSVTADSIRTWAGEIGLDSNQFNACFSSGKFDSAIQATENEGIGIGINGTPSFVIGKTGGTGELIIGNEPYSQLRATIDKYLAQ